MVISVGSLAVAWGILRDIIGTCSVAILHHVGVELDPPNSTPDVRTAYRVVMARHALSWGPLGSLLTAVPTSARDQVLCSLLHPRMWGEEERDEPHEPENARTTACNGDLAGPPPDFGSTDHGTSPESPYRRSVSCRQWCAETQCAETQSGGEWHRPDRRGHISASLAP